MDELEGLVIRECAVSGGEGILFYDLMQEVGRRCGNPISAPLQKLLWRRVRLLTCIEFSRDALDREVQLQAEPRLEPGSKGQPLRPLPRGEPIAQSVLPERIEQMQELQRLRLTAIAHTRMKELGWITTDTPQSVRVLEVIAKSREKGMLQSNIAKETGLDAKSVFYYMKPLKARDLIDLKSVTIQNDSSSGKNSCVSVPCIKTNIVYLRRFAPAAGDETTGHEGVNTLEDTAPIEARALQFLQDSPGGIAAEARCKKHALALWLGVRSGKDSASSLKGKRNHMWERLRRGLQGRGLIQRIMLRTEEGGVKKEGSSSHDFDDVTQPLSQEVICLKLLDSSASAPAQQQQPVGVVAQVSTLEQMLRIIQVLAFLTGTKVLAYWYKSSNTDSRCYASCSARVHWVCYNATCTRP